MRFRTCARALSAGALFASVAGCGAVSGVIPDQSIRDPLKLNAVGIRATVADTRVFARAEKLAGPFENIGSLPVSPRDFRLEQPIRSACRIGLSGGTLPPTLTLRDINFTLTVSDTDGRTVTLPSAVIAGPIECARVEGTTSDYSLNLGPYQFAQSLGEKKDALLSILRTGGQNTVVGVLTLDIASNPTLANGSTITFWFEEGKGIASF